MLGCEQSKTDLDGVQLARLCPGRIWAHDDDDDFVNILFFLLEFAIDLFYIGMMLTNSKLLLIIRLSYNLKHKLLVAKRHIKFRL